MARKFLQLRSKRLFNRGVMWITNKDKAKLKNEDANALIFIELIDEDGNVIVDENGNVLGYYISAADIEQNLFIAVFDTTLSGSASDTLILPYPGGNKVYWGDGLSSNTNTHTYSAGGVYTVTIVGEVAGFAYDNSATDKDKLIQVLDWSALIAGLEREPFIGIYSVDSLTLSIPHGGNLIDWGDGTQNLETTHTYASNAEYTVTIYGLLELQYNNIETDRDKLIEVIQWPNVVDKYEA